MAIRFHELMGLIAIIIATYSAPCVQQINPLFRLAHFPCRLREHVDSKSAFVNLRGSELDVLIHLRVQPDESFQLQHRLQSACTWIDIVESNFHRNLLRDWDIFPSEA